MPRRKVIALLTNNVGMRSDYQGLLREGVEQACIERNIDLWVYAGCTDWKSCGRAQSVVYSLVSSQQIDGVIVVAGCIASGRALEKVLSLLEDRCRVPTCAIGQRCPSVSSLLVDNHGGAAEIARHLVRVHDRRYFVYVAGPPGHEESEQRLAATREALARLGVDLSEDAVIYGDFSAISGLEATRELLRGGQAFDALIAANDDMAVGAIEALEAVGIHCPDDVAVAGFDDAPRSRTCDPRLTTVRQPIMELGSAAVSHLVGAWQGNPPPEVVTFPTEPVLRESCGCHRAWGGRYERGEGASQLPPARSQSVAAEALAPLLNHRVTRDRWAQAFSEALDAECAGERGALKRELQELLGEVAHPDSPIHELQHLVNSLRSVAETRGLFPELDQTFYDAQVLVGQTIHRREGRRRLHEENLTEQLRGNWELLASSFERPKLRAALESQLPRLSIRNAFVATFARDDPDALVPLACVTDGRPVPLAEAPYPARQLLPEGALTIGERRSLAILPLTFEWQRLGAAVLELPQSHELYAVLREQIGSAVKTMQLHEDVLRQARLNAQAEEERRVAAERLRSLSLIAGGVAHDLNNVLGPLVGLPETIACDLRQTTEQNVGVPPAVFEDLDTLRQAGLRAADTIRDLLTLGQTNATTKVPVEVNRLLTGEGFIQSAVADRNPAVKVRVLAANCPLTVRASKAHMVRAVSNLVINAAEAIHGPGTITVRASARSLTEAQQGIERIEPGHYAVIEVEDTGPGIASENIGHVFEPFFSSKTPGRPRSGAGLGLAIVHRIVKDALGFVAVTSELGSGSKFELYLPLDAGGNARMSSRPVPAGRGTERILVVDDEPVQLRTARRILEQLGYSVATAPSGEAALALWKGSHPMPEFELVVLDMMMPGLDGVATLEQMRRHRPGQRALMVTGYTPEQGHRTSGNRGDLWLMKPYRPEELGKAVRRALEGG
ncbi:MAG: substrate-binding domain-containing protein [Polyangiaceae bacterium]|nr:substrate-binding domain-containing protein [Polyangiaceae bacterium]